MLISQVWSNLGVLWIFPENTWKGWNEMGRTVTCFRLFALSPVYFITGFRAVGGDYAITDALLLCSLRYLHVKKFFNLFYPFQYLLVETSTMYAAHGVRNIGKCWSRRCFVTWSARTYSLTQCWLSWTTRNKLNWNLNSNIFIHENGLENTVCKMATVLFWPQYVDNTNPKCNNMLHKYKIHCPSVVVSEDASKDLNSSPHGQKGRHFADDSFKCIFVNEKFCILIKISLNFGPRDPIDNNPALV